jgi:hypothetical protein
MIPDGARLRVVGDVHGDARAFAFAAETPTAPPPCG